MSVTPFHSDFISPLEDVGSEELCGLSSTVAVAGRGIMEITVVDLYGRVSVLQTEAYYMPSALIHLFSPQKYF